MRVRRTPGDVHDAGAGAKSVAAKLAHEERGEGGGAVVVLALAPVGAGVGAGGRARRWRVGGDGVRPGRSVGGGTARQVRQSAVAHRLARMVRGWRHVAPGRSASSSVSGMLSMISTSVRDDDGGGSSGSRGRRSAAHSSARVSTPHPSFAARTTSTTAAASWVPSSAVSVHAAKCFEKAAPCATTPRARAIPPKSADDASPSPARARACVGKRERRAW